MITKIRTLMRRIIDRLRTYIFITDAVACFPQLKGRRLTGFDDGKDNFTIEFDHDLIIQTPRRKEDNGRMILEYHLLMAVRGHLGISVPEPIFFSDGKGKCKTVMISYRKIDGMGADAFRGVSTDLESFSEQVGNFLKTLHNMPVSLFKGSLHCDQEDSNYYKKHQEALNFFYRKGDEILRQDERTFLESYFKMIIDEIEKDSGNRCVIHHDLRTEHIIIDPENMKISGVVDWMDSCLGDPSEDFAFIMRDMGFNFYKKVMAHYGKSGSIDFTRRCLFYSLLSFFNDIISFYNRDAIKLHETIERLYKMIEAARSNLNYLGLKSE